MEEFGAKVRNEFISVVLMESTSTNKCTGLVTFSDESNGFPRHEGHFQDCRFMRRLKCGDSIQRAQKVALMARALCDEH